MSALTEFLLARIYDDECLARWAFAYHNDNGPDWSERWSGAVEMGGDGHELLLCNDSGVSRHIVNFDPARVLAECEAKRKIIAFHESWPVLVQTPTKFDQDPIPGVDNLDNYTYRMSQEIAWATTREYVARFGVDPPTAPMLAALAAVYADHPDYHAAQEEG